MEPVTMFNWRWFPYFQEQNPSGDAENEVSVTILHTTALND
jgi:hypothetical protein